jgi:hypothetical protein
MLHYRDWDRDRIRKYKCDLQVPMFNDRIGIEDRIVYLLSL